MTGLGNRGQVPHQQRGGAVGEPVLEPKVGVSLPLETDIRTCQRHLVKRMALPLMAEKKVTIRSGIGNKKWKLNWFNRSKSVNLFR